MSSKIPILSSKEVVKILERFGFLKYHKKVVTLNIRIFKTIKFA